MRSSARSLFPTIRTEGAILPSELLRRTAKKGVTYRVEPKLPADVLGAYVYLP